MPVPRQAGGQRLRGPLLRPRLHLPDRLDDGPEGGRGGHLPRGPPLQVLLRGGRGQRGAPPAHPSVHQHRGQQLLDAGGPRECRGLRPRVDDGHLQPGDLHAGSEEGDGCAREEAQPSRQHPESGQPDGRRGHQERAGCHRQGEQAARLLPLQHRRRDAARGGHPQMHELHRERLRPPGHPHQQAGVQPAGALRGLLPGQLLQPEPGLRPFPDPRRRGRLPHVQGADGQE